MPNQALSKLLQQSTIEALDSAIAIYLHIYAQAYGETEALLREQYMRGFKQARMERAEVEDCLRDVVGKITELSKETGIRVPTHPEVNELFEKKVKISDMIRDNHEDLAPELSRAALSAILSKETTLDQLQELETHLTKELKG